VPSMREVWFPASGERVVLLRWLFSEWCNYRCPYCPQTHDRHAVKGEGITAHAFDNHPIEKWISGFDRHFESTRLSIVLTGGESMLDRPNMTKLLNYLSGKDNVECIRIDTNAWWKAEQFSDVDSSKIILMCTYHPSQVTEERFISRVDSYVQAGFQIGILNYVMDGANIENFIDDRQKFAVMGLALHPNPLWGSNGTYAPHDLAIMKTVLPDIDYDYRTGAVDPYGNGCYFPALSYEMDLAGNVIVGCHPELRGSFFDETLPQRPKDKVPCPHHSCVYLDKYSFIDGSERNVSTNPLGEYRKTLIAKAKLFIK